MAKKSSIRLAKLSIGLSAAITAPTCAAQGAPSEHGTLEDIVVTARRVTERLQDTPLSVSAVTGDTLAKQAITNIAQLNNIAPNLSVQAFPGDRTAPMFNIRGQITTNSNIAIDPAVSVYVDNVYVARTAGNITNLVDVDRVEVLRGPQGTLFGRNSTGGAVSLISKQPTDRLEGTAQIRAGNYGLIEETGVVNVPLGMDGVAVRLVAQNSKRDGYDRGYNRIELNDDHSLFLRGILRVAPAGSRLTATVSADYTRFHGTAQPTKFIFANPVGLPGPLSSSTRKLVALCGAPLLPSGCPAVPVGLTLDSFTLGSVHQTGTAAPTGPLAKYPLFASLFSRSKVWGASINLQYELGSATLKSITAWRHLDRQQSNDLDGTPYTILASAQDSHQSQFTEELQAYGSALSDRLKYTLGGFYFVEHGLENSATANVVPLAGAAASISNVNGTAANKSYALYGQLNYKLTDQLTLTVGSRHTWEKRGIVVLRTNQNIITGTETCLFDASVPLDSGVFCRASPKASFHYWSYTAGLDYKITPDVMVYFRTDRASRAGGFNRGPTNIAGFLPYRPERVTNYELGVKADLLDRHLRANISLFQENMKDIQRNVTQAITLPSGLPATITQTINAARGRVRGAEFELTARPNERLTLNGSLGLLKTEYLSFVDLNTSVTPAVLVDRSSEQFPLTPKVSYTLGATYNVPFHGGSTDISTDWSYTGRTISSASFPVSPFSAIPGYGLLGARIKTQLDNGIFFTVWGTNLLDKEYLLRTLDQTTNGLGFISGIPGPPRTFGITMGANFGG